MSIGWATLFCVVCGSGAFGRLSFLLLFDTSCLVTAWLLGIKGFAWTFGTNCVLAARFSVDCECPYVFFFVALAVAVSSFLSLRDRSSNSQTSFPLSLTFISATPGLALSTSLSATTARSANMAKFSSDELSGCVAKCARTEGGVCRMRDWRIMALPTTAFVPKPAVFCNHLRNHLVDSFRCR